MSRTALFVIDIQHALALDPQTAIPHASRVTETSIAILSRARAHIDSARAKGQIPDLEIIVVQHEETPDRGNLQRGSQAWELVFPPRDGDKNERVVGKDVRM
jgi:nicotinamidase-related amidase